MKALYYTTSALLLAGASSATQINLQHGTTTPSVHPLLAAPSDVDFVEHQDGSGIVSVRLTAAKMETPKSRQDHILERLRLKKIEN